MMGDDMDYVTSHVCVDCNQEYEADHDDMRCREDGEWRCIDCENKALAIIADIHDEVVGIMEDYREAIGVRLLST